MKIPIWVKRIRGTLPIMHSPRLPHITNRPSLNHLDPFGHCVIVGGNVSVALTAMAALRSGAGRVEVCVPNSIRSTVASFSPCYECFDENKAVDYYGRSNRKPKVIILGPKTNPFIASALYSNHSACLIVHPDVFMDLFKSNRWMSPKNPTATLFSYKSAQVFKDDSDLVYANETTGVGISPSFHIARGLSRVHVDTGNRGLQRIGSEAVHCGVIGGLMAGTLLDLFQAAHLGTHIFGLAADLAATYHGEISMTMSDVVDWLPKAFGIARQRSL